jgi:hypothetical protein
MGIDNPHFRSYGVFPVDSPARAASAAGQVISGPGGRLRAVRVKDCPYASDGGGPGGGAVLDGVLERVTFANPETGYTIARIAPERGTAELVTAAGPLLGAQVGELLRLRGRW